MVERETVAFQEAVQRTDLVDEAGLEFLLGIRRQSSQFLAKSLSHRFHRHLSSPEPLQVREGRMSADEDVVGLGERHGLVHDRKVSIVW